MMTFMCGPLWLPEGIPDLSSDQDPCCAGRALEGPRGCTCWVEVLYPLVQADPRPGPPAVPDPVQPCLTCAYRGGSPEKRGEAGFGADGADLERLAAEDIPFFCHDGMRYLIGYVHLPSSRSWSPQLGDYRPPIVDGVPYQADGQPGVLCAGWMLRRDVLARQREAARQDGDTVTQPAETAARPGQDLAYHLVGVHKNAAAIGNDQAANEDLHGHEHHGPGGLRLHDPADLYWDPDAVEAVLEEAEADDDAP